MRSACLLRRYAWAKRIRSDGLWIGDFKIRAISSLVTRGERRLISRKMRGGSLSEFENVSGYRSMWLVVCFDLPVGDNDERRRATGFRNKLLGEGFSMKQWSVYTRFFISRAQAEAAADRIGGNAPPMGKVSIMFITDKQYGMVRNYEGRASKPAEQKPDQLALF
jgi:CRISPR-associated protein Cas2